MTPFQKVSTTTTAATYLLIGVGGFVRAAGAGLGCPDWPRCFGRWVPPTTADQLPPGVDPALFNFQLAWIEYINRLCGVAVGLLIVATAYLAWRDHRRQRLVLWPALGALALVVFQGWFGGQVVAMELDPRFVTVHLLGALAIVAALMVAGVESFIGAGSPPSPGRADCGRVRALAGTLVGAVVVQVVLGALVRGSIDMSAEATPDMGRGLHLARVGALDTAHRSWGLVVLLGCAGLSWVGLRCAAGSPSFRRVAQVPGWLALAQVAAGFGLATLDLPPALQVSHVFLGSLLFGSLLLALLLSTRITADGALEP